MRPARSTSQPSDDRPVATPFKRRDPGPRLHAWARRPMSRRQHGRPHQHAPGAADRSRNAATGQATGTDGAPFDAAPPVHPAGAHLHGAGPSVDLPRDGGPAPTHDGAPMNGAPVATQAPASTNGAS